MRLPAWLQFVILFFLLAVPGVLAARTSQREADFTFGQEIILYAPIGDVLPLLSNDQTIEEYLDRSKDFTTETYLKWIREKRLTVIADGTRAVVQEARDIESGGLGFRVVNVRIGEGKARDKLGWVYSKWVKAVR